MGITASRLSPALKGLGWARGGSGVLGWWFSGRLGLWFLGGWRWGIPAWRVMEVVILRMLCNLAWRRWLWFGAFCGLGDAQSCGQFFCLENGFSRPLGWSGGVLSRGMVKVWLVSVVVVGTTGCRSLAPCWVRDSFSSVVCVLQTVGCTLAFFGSF
ncbi:hypothetical protein TIFTF001_029416 [Ficus carica]|uniref:Uncharacterized protein n=1 Tax=Ficus carica TaxID=3494 RepID=A0AA88J1I9_FICCA|nr:hypothetical protein TIFTF001_029416 [Ficus carica]